MDYKEFEKHLDEAQALVKRYEQIVEASAKARTEDSGMRYAYMYGLIISELRGLIYRHPEAAASLAKTVDYMEKDYVVDVLKKDAKVKS